jgi:hypothetical protein
VQCICVMYFTTYACTGPPCRRCLVAARALLCALRRLSTHSRTLGSNTVPMCIFFRGHKQQFTYIVYCWDSMHVCMTLVFMTAALIAAMAAAAAAAAACTVCCTTETFSTGLNMPAKTVVFTNVRKYDGGGFRWAFPALAG